MILIKQGDSGTNYLSEPFLLQNPNNILIPQELFLNLIPLSCLETDLQMLLICRLKLSWSSMCISSNVTDEATSTLSLLIKNCLGLLV